MGDERLSDHMVLNGEKEEVKNISLEKAVDVFATFKNHR
jgi:hypothetical protein